MTAAKIIPAVLCGGSGSRLWPLSRRNIPKQFLNILGEDTLLQRTMRRTLGILDASGDDVVTVTLSSMKDETERQLAEISPALTRHLILEPQARNTAAAVALAAHYISNYFGDNSLVWILPADHFIGDEDALRQAVENARLAAEDGWLVTFGIQPSRPETGYGYVRKADRIDGCGAFSVSSFVEKPDAETARSFLEDGGYLWSSGMHLFRARTAKESFLEFAPHTWSVIEHAMRDSFNPRAPSALTYGVAAEEPFETAVIEKARNVAVLPCDLQWSDIGCWESIWEIRDKDPHGNALEGNVFCHGTKNSMIVSRDRLVTCVGLENVLVVETDDSVLVAEKNCNGSLKAMVQNLQKLQMDETVHSATTRLSWGRMRLMAETPGLRLREIVVTPGQAMDAGLLEEGETRWIVVSGHASFLVDGAPRHVARGESLHIGAGSRCSVMNESDRDLRLYELHFIQPVTGLAEEKISVVPRAAAREAVHAVA